MANSRDQAGDNWEDDMQDLSGDTNKKLNITAAPFVPGGAGSSLAPRPQLVQSGPSKTLSLGKPAAAAAPSSEQSTKEKTASIQKSSVPQNSIKNDTSAQPTSNSSKAPKTASVQKSATKAEGAPEKRETDAVVKEQEENVDEELVQDLYGKEHVNLVFIGHVDAGKSTLGGNLLYVTGMVDQRTMEKLERESKEAGRATWYLSWALDSTKEERSKGKTVEVGRAYFETEKRRYTVLDAPGHKSYVPNMISGATQADLGVLVISARKGEFETGFERGGQTREHAVLAKTQGVNKLLVVINKMDDPTVMWDKERFDECVSKLTPFLKGAGFNPKTDIFFIPVSAYTGKGLKEPVPKDLCPWWDGPTLLGYLDSMQSFERKTTAPLMLPIAAKYKDMGTIIEGKIESGHLRKGQSLVLMPNKVPVDVTAVYGESEEEVQGAVSGDQVRLRIKGVEEEDVLVGYVLSTPKYPVHVVTSFDAQIVIIDLKGIIAPGYTCIMHIHTAVEEVTIEVSTIPS